MCLLLKAQFILQAYVSQSVFVYFFQSLESVWSQPLLDSSATNDHVWKAKIEVVPKAKGHQKEPIFETTAAFSTVTKSPLISKGQNEGQEGQDQSEQVR